MMVPGILFPKNENILYAGTDLGIYVSIDKEEWNGGVRYFIFKQTAPAPASSSSFRLLLAFAAGGESKNDGRH
jgi:hypothetical protein